MRKRHPRVIAFAQAKAFTDFGVDEAVVLARHEVASRLGRHARGPPGRHIDPQVAAESTRVAKLGQPVVTPAAGREHAAERDDKVGLAERLLSDAGAGGQRRAAGGAAILAVDRLESARKQLGVAAILVAQKAPVTL